MKLQVRNVHHVNCTVEAFEKQFACQTDHLIHRRTLPCSAGGTPLFCRSRISQENGVSPVVSGGLESDDIESSLPVAVVQCEARRRGVDIFNPV